jgi:hypothetical protein
MSALPAAFLAQGHLPARTMNRTEAAHYTTLCWQQKAGEILSVEFQVLKLFIGQTPDGRQMWYAPDFFVQLADRSLEVHEVKGPYITEDSAVKLVAAARLYPQFRFVRYQRTKRGWERKVIGG